MKSVFPLQLKTVPLEARTGSRLSSWAPPLAPTRESMEPITVLVLSHFVGLTPVLSFLIILCMQLKKFGKQIH